MNVPIINLYRQAEDYFFRGISSFIDLGDGANAYMTGGAELNFIYITRHTNVLDKILIQGKQFYDQGNFSFDVIIPQKLCTSQIVDTFNIMGYSQKSKSISMVLHLDRFAIDKPASFDVEIMINANDDQLNDWMMPMIGAFESTFDICSIYAIAHENALKMNTNLRHFSLYKQDTPIASITLSMKAGLARIDDVSTCPEFQGKGYGTHIVRYVLSEAKRLGASYCFLESSDSGFAIYQKPGFEPLFKNNIYSRKV